MQTGEESLLVINVGSATLKHGLFNAHDDQCIEKGSNDHDGTLQGVKDGLAHLLQSYSGQSGPTIAAVGHRVVHGGAQFCAPARITTEVLTALHDLVPLAPLHLPHNIAGIEAALATLPHVPHLACFDTAFHRTQDELFQHYGLPRNYFAQGIRRYGFHGLSYESIANQLPAHLGALAEGRVIVAHLGNGASLCALQARQSVATSMGFSTLDGLLMGTRCGSLDPGVLLYLMAHEGMDAAALTELLYQQSGLLGMSGLSSDMQALLASKASEAAEAIRYFCRHVVEEIGRLAAVLGGVDALVFTGGIGEHAGPIREAILSQLEWLNLKQHCVITCDEQGVIAHHLRANIGF